MFYESANPDKADFDASESFDIIRSPNPDVGLAGAALTSASAPTWRRPVAGAVLSSSTAGAGD